MSQTSPSPLRGALFMVLAGIAFAAANAITWTVTYKMGFKPQSDAFWQYAIAMVFSAPFIWRQGLSRMKTRHPLLHGARILLSVDRGGAGVFGRDDLATAMGGGADACHALPAGRRDLLGRGFADHQAPDARRAANRDHHVAFGADRAS